MGDIFDVFVMTDHSGELHTCTLLWSSLALGRLQRLPGAQMFMGISSQTSMCRFRQRHIWS